MKTLKFLVIGISLFLAYTANAQVAVTVNFGSPPQWGPVGYSNVRYYYLPDVECYYDIQMAKFIYYNGFVWVHKSYLPVKHKNYDLYNGYKVVMTDYRGDKPYNNFREHKTKYAKGYHDQSQRSIGRKSGERISNPQVNNSNHSNQIIRHNNSWKSSPKQENNRDKGRGQKNKKGNSNRK